MRDIATQASSLTSAFAPRCAGNIINQNRRTKMASSTHLQQMKQTPKPSFTYARRRLQEQ
jgi:hypothetical protein